MPQIKGRLLSISLDGQEIASFNVENGRAERVFRVSPKDASHRPAAPLKRPGNRIIHETKGFLRYVDTTPPTSTQ